MFSIVEQVNKRQQLSQFTNKLTSSRWRQFRKMLNIFKMFRALKMSICCNIQGVCFPSQISKFCWTIPVVKAWSASSYCKLSLDSLAGIITITIEWVLGPIVALQVTGYSSIVKFSKMFLLWLTLYWNPAFIFKETFLMLWVLIMLEAFEGTVFMFHDTLLLGIRVLQFQLP